MRRMKKVLWTIFIDNMQTLFIIFGRSCVGKTTFIRQLQEKYGDKIHEAISITTRPIRPGEVEGKDYHFVSREHYTLLEHANALTENIRYNGNCYGLERSQFLQEVPNVVLVEPTGLKQLLGVLSDDFKIIKIKVEENDDTLVERFKKRGDPDEIRNKRIYGDKDYFANVPFDYLINSKFELLDFIVRLHSSLGN